MDPKECDFHPKMFEQYLNMQLTVHHCDTLATHFKNHKIFSDDQFSEVLKNSGPQKKMKFLHHFQSVTSNPRCYPEFVNIMNAVGATHITDYLEGRTVNKMVTMKLWEESLSKHYVAFLEAFNPEPVLQLYGPTLFDNPTLEHINSLPTRSEKVNAFFIHVVKKPNWMEMLLIALRDRDGGDMTYFAQLLDPDDNLQGKAFSNLVHLCVPLFQEKLDPDDILDDMSCIPGRSKRYIRSIKARKEKVTAFVNILTSLDVGWFKELKAALDCRIDKPEYQELLDILDPNVTGSTVESRKVPDENPNLNKSVSPVSHDKEIEVLVLRDYQLELAQTGLEGRNCMIVAPTGSGKTFVALHICIEHMKKVKNPKVILLVPRIPLVKQQFELFKRFMPNDLKIFQVTGEMSLDMPVHILIERHDVIVMTAQVLVNLISDGLRDITDITMLIFDECHHTVKNEPYNQIMRVYLDKRYEKKDAKLPQVVGLTASPGMGKAKTVIKVHDNIKMLMANLDVKTAPVQVRTEKGDLDGFQHEAQDEVITVYRRDENSFFRNIKAKMQHIQKLIEEDITRFENVLEGRVVFDLRATPGTQDYEAWAVNLLNKSKLIKHDESSQRFMAYARHLHEYNNSLMLNDHVRSVDALEYITEVLFKKDPINSIEKKMKKIFDTPQLKPSDDGNPLLDSLKDKLCEEFSEKPNSRCIIFVKTRAIARALLNYLTEQTQLKKFNLNPKQLTGAVARRVNFGMTKVGQNNSLRAFREGICKVLVATSMAEERLDIKECNLIITYNYSTNEVGQVQRKSRGREKDSKVVMLAYSDSGHVEREQENTMRMEFTQDILSKLQVMEPKQLEREIAQIQETLQKDREFEKVVEICQSKVRKPNPGVFRLSCLWCKKTITSSDKFRHIKKQHRVVVDREFNDRAEFKVVPDSEAKQLGDEQFLIGKIFCKNKECRRVWGLRMRYKNFPISVLRIENFLITNDKGYRAVKKKWKDAPFVVDKELTSENLTELLRIRDYDEEEDDPKMIRS